MSSKDTSPWVPLTEEEMEGPTRIVTEEEMDVLDLVQHYGADPYDPLSIERARGRREVSQPLALERTQAAIRAAEVHTAYGRRDREQRRKAGTGNQGRRAWYTLAVGRLLESVCERGTEPGAAHQHLLRASDKGELDGIIDGLADLGVIDIGAISSTYPSRDGTAVLLVLVRGDGAGSREVTVNAWQHCVKERNKSDQNS